MEMSKKSIPARKVAKEIGEVLRKLATRAISLDNKPKTKISGTKIFGLGLISSSIGEGLIWML